MGVKINQRDEWVEFRGRGLIDPTAVNVVKTMQGIVRIHEAPSKQDVVIFTS